MPLSETFCSVSYVQPYLFQFIEEDLYDVTSFRDHGFVSRQVSDSFLIVSGPSWSLLVLTMKMRMRMLFLFLEDARNPRDGYL